MNTMKVEYISLVKGDDDLSFFLHQEGRKKFYAFFHSKAASEEAAEACDAFDEELRHRGNPFDAAIALAAQGVLKGEAYLAWKNALDAAQRPGDKDHAWISFVKQISTQAYQYMLNGDAGSYDAGATLLALMRMAYPRIAMIMLQFDEAKNGGYAGPVLVSAYYEDGRFVDVYDDPRLYPLIGREGSDGERETRAAALTMFPDAVVVDDSYMVHTVAGILQFRRAAHFALNVAKCRPLQFATAALLAAGGKLNKYTPQEYVIYNLAVRDSYHVDDHGSVAFYHIGNGQVSFSSRLVRFFATILEGLPL